MAKYKNGQPNPEVVAREAEVIKLRRGGLTWDLVGERVGLTAMGALKAYQRGINRIVRDDVDELRGIENDRLDIMQAAIWGKVLQGDNVSISNAIRIAERRAKLNGLDAPTRIQAEVISYDGNSVRAELERILAQSSDSSEKGALAEGFSESEPTTAGQ